MIVFGSPLTGKNNVLDVLVGLIVDVDPYLDRLSVIIRLHEKWSKTACSFNTGIISPPTVNFINAVYCWAITSSLVCQVFRSKTVPIAEKQSKEPINQ